MPVTERHEDPGSFNIQLQVDLVPWGVIRDLGEMGHIVITPNWHLHPDMFDEDDFLAAARYSGIVLEVSWEKDVINLRGQGNVWHLGDGFGNGPILGSDVTFTAATPATVLALATGGGLIPPALTVGTITGTGVSAYTGTFYASQTCLECIRTYMSAVNMHFRINPDWSLDACLATRDEVFTVTTPTVVATPKGFGSDPSYTGIEPTALRTTVDATRWVSRSVVENEDAAGAKSILSFVNRSTIPYQDPQGNELVRNVIQSGPASDDVGYTDFHARTLEEWNTISSQEINTDQYAFSGPFSVGDYIYVFDPVAGFTDPDTQIAFRGRYINPMKIQVVEDEWPITSNLGVYFKPSTVDYRQAVLTDSPIGYWRLGESSGTTATDETGNNNMTYVGTPTLAYAGVMQDGSGDTSMDVAGGDNGVDGGDWADFEFLGTLPFTVEAWIRPDTELSTSWGGVIAQKQIDASGNGWELILHGGTGGMNIRMNRVGTGSPGHQAQTPDGSIVADNTYHIVGTFDGTTTTIWINGQVAASNSHPVSMLTSGVTLSFGHDTEQATSYLPGPIDEVAIYDKVLSDDRIRVHQVIGSRGTSKTGNWIDLTRYVRSEQ